LQLETSIGSETHIAGPSVFLPKKDAALTSKIPVVQVGHDEVHPTPSALVPVEEVTGSSKVSENKVVCPKPK
jgi:hypothetical protein